MSDFREELIEAIRNAAMPELFISEQTAIRILDAALAFRQTVECPECGGTGESAPIKEWGKRCPAGCIDGRVPGETRLAIVEPAERLPAFSDVLREGPPVFLLAPDLPEGTQP